MHPTLRDPLLWQAIAAHPLGGSQAAKSFVQRLAKENCWNLSQAEAAIMEYRRFCYLQRLSPTGLTPSHAVDQVWHQHLLYTQDYWRQFCGRVLGRDLHHEPSIGSSADGARFREQYAQTLAQYEREFGLADEQYWPGLLETFAPSNWHWQNSAVKASPSQRRRWLARPSTWSTTLRRYWPVALVLIGALLLTLGVQAQVESMGAGAAQSSNPLEYNGAEFLSFYLKMLFAALVLSEILRRVLTPKTEPSGKLSDPEIAYLDAGEDRALKVLEVEQIAAGNLVYDPATRLLQETHSVRGSRIAQDLAALRLTLGTTAHELRQRLLMPIMQSLQQRGLLLEPAQRSKIAWISVSPLLALLALGTAKVNIGLTRGKPIAFLVVLLIFTGIALLVQYSRRPRVSAGCKTWLKKERARLARVRTAPTQQEWGQAVALFGLSAIAGTALADYVGWRQPAASASSCGSDGGSSYSSDSSSDSGSSDSGGSGCGGCGGGD